MSKRKRIAPVFTHENLLFIPNGSVMTSSNNKLHCCSGENAEYAYDDIHSCCHHYGYGNFAPQLCTLAGTMNALQNAFLCRVTWEKAQMMAMITNIICMPPRFKWLISSEVDLHTSQNCTGCEVIKGCTHNQPQSSALAPHTVWAWNSLFITHLPLRLQTDGGPERNSKPRCCYCRQQCGAVIKTLQSYPEIHNGTWSQAAAVQGCTHYIHPQRADWKHWGPPWGPETIRSCDVVHQPEKDIVKRQYSR